MIQQEAFNRGTWLRHVSKYAAAEGFTDEGERAAYDRLLDQLHGAAVLDIGVGGGRTVALLRPLARRYVGIDYLPAMVAACRARHPDVDVRLGDARNLSRLSDTRFDVVVFSHNGLDTLDRRGRLSALREVRRVLRPGGIFWFSTHNLDGPEPRQRPWRLEAPSLERGLLRGGVALLRTARRTPGAIVNYLRARRSAAAGDGWALLPLRAHQYRLLVHYTTLERLRRDVAAAGFRGELLALDHRTGAEVPPGDVNPGAHYVHALVRA